MKYQEKMAVTVGIITFALLMIIMPKPVFSQSVNVSVSEMDAADHVTYYYRVINNTAVPIVQVRIGFDKSQLEPPLLLVLPRGWTHDGGLPSDSVGGPPGWQGDVIVSHESDFIYLEWRIDGNVSDAINPGTVAPKFYVVLDKPTEEYRTTTFDVVLANSQQVDGQLQLEADRITLNEKQVTFKPDLPSEQTTTGPLVDFRSQVGDADNFQGGDLADELSPVRNNQSQHVQDLLTFFSPANGFQGAVNLDTPAVNQAVGFTHMVNVILQSQITDTTVTFTIRGTGDNVANDTILYNDSMLTTTPPPGAFSGFAPFIALRDLLGQEPQANKIYTLSIDLGQVPVRFANTSSPGGHFTGGPDIFLDLRPLLARDGGFDMVFSDDTEVDGSILRGTAVQPIGTGCPAGSVAQFKFTATLTNLMPNIFDDIRIMVDPATSAGIQLLLPNGVLVPPTSDALLYDLTPGHVNTLPGGGSVVVPFTLCIPSLERFNFFVNVTAVPLGQ